MATNTPNPPPNNPNAARDLIRALEALTKQLGGKSVSTGGGGGDWWTNDKVLPKLKDEGPSWWLDSRKTLNLKDDEPKAAAPGQPAAPKGKPEKIPSVTSASPKWNKLAKRSWFEKLGGRAGASARKLGGRAAGLATKAGITSAGKSLAMGWPVGMAARSGLASAGGALAAAGGPVGIAVIAVGALAKAAKAAYDALNQLSQEQVNYGRELSKASATMAVLYAQRDLQEFLRNREKGDRLAGSSELLLATEQQYGEGTKEIDILWNDVKNNVAAAWNALKTGLVEPINEVARLINEWLGNKEDDSADLTLGEWADTVRSHDRQVMPPPPPKWE